MLNPNLVNALDMAAAGGVLDYDGAAFITGTQPRYMGSPEFPVYGTPNNANLQQPSKDEMIYKDKPEQKSSNPLWKKLLFGALVVGVGIFGYKKLKNMPSVKDWFTKVSQKTQDKVKNIKKPDTSKWPSVKDCWTKVSGFFKDNWNKLFKKKTAPTA